MTDRTDRRTLVLLCADLETLGHGLDLEAVQQWLQGNVAAAHVQLAPDLDHRPGGIAKAMAASGAARLVLGLCSGEYAIPEMQVQARKAGLDPLGVEAVNLGAYAAWVRPRPPATEKAKILLAAAVARARAYPGSRPENAKPHVPARVSRRSLFSLSLLEYRPVPSIQGERCAAGSGCRVCVQVCPCGALEEANGQVSLEKSRCESCGLCLTACPRDAIQFPGQAPAQLAAQLTTLLDPTVGALQPRGLLFTCPRSALALETLAKKRFQISRSDVERGTSNVELFPVQVPCLGMVPPTWLLGCLNLGAAAIRLAPCLGRCPLDQKETIEGKIAYCREVLQLLGDSPDRIRPLQTMGEGIAYSALQRDVTPDTGSVETKSWNPSPARTLLQFARERPASNGFSLAHPHSPFGLIDVSGDCTGCGVCAVACPTDALALERRNGDLALTFDGALCTACGQCLPRCPEVENRVLNLERVTDLQRLAQGRVALYEDREGRCQACGAPIAPEAMMGRIRAKLGDEYAATFEVITGYCPDCRGWSR